MRLIGDIHGKFEQYFKLLDCDKSVQIGDFGKGFGPTPTLPEGHRFIRGNHDDPALCREDPAWIADGTFEGDILFVGGAWSIDRNIRTPGVNWWPDEEVSVQRHREIIAEAKDRKPRIIVTHDCPQFICDYFYGPGGKFVTFGFGVGALETVTGLAFNDLFDTVKPEMWFFGHHHISWNARWKGCEFRCLAELEPFDL